MTCRVQFCWLLAYQIVKPNTVNFHLSQAGLLCTIGTSIHRLFL